MYSSPKSTISFPEGLVISRLRFLQRSAGKIAGLGSLAGLFGTTWASAAAAACSNLPHADHPKATLHQGATTAVVFLPDTRNGYYRASRFDWSGVVPCLNRNGHDFFGEWFPHYDPLLNDAITGPVEEFRSDEGAIGYDAAKPGEPFVKIGVGVLRRIDSRPYEFGITYPLLDSGRWTTDAKSNSVVFTQELHGPNGVAYRYQKVLRLQQDGSVLTLEHTLTNLGSTAIDTGVYDHDFFMLDHRPTGPGLRVKFPFALKSVPPPSGPAEGSLEPTAQIEGNELIYKQPLAPHQTVSSYLGGYGSTASDYDITVSETTSGISVRQTADRPISKLYLWSIPTTVAPEAYIHLNVAPGASTHWTIHYAFATP